MSKIKLKSNESGTGTLTIEAPNTDTDKTLTLPTSDGTLVTTDGATFTGNVNFGDNDKAIFGAGSDLQIYHDGSNSYIKDAGTGKIKLLANEWNVNNAADTANMIVAKEGAEIKLHYNGSAKLATTSTGIDVTGTVTADDLTVTSTSPIFDVKSDGDGFPTFKISRVNGVTKTNQSYYYRVSSSGDLLLVDETDSNKNRMKLAQNGDISLYEDTGTTAKFFWDASTESLGIGTSGVGTYALNVDSGTKGVSNAEAGIYSNATRSGVTWNLVSNNTYTSTNTGTGIKFTSGDFDTGALLVRADGTASSGDAAGYMTFHTSNNGSEDLAERMRIDSSGNVGIGTGASTPVRELEVKGAGSDGTQIQVTATSDSAGIKFIPASGDAFEVQATTTEWIVYNRTDNQYIIRIDGAGRIRMPYQPAFYAYGGSTNNVGAGNGQVVIFTSTELNRGSHYSTSNGRFTAPVAGAYFFTASVRLDGANQEYFRIRLTKNASQSYARPHAIYDLGTTWDPRYFSLTVSGVINLAANDYVQTIIDVDTDSSVNIYRNESSFSGYLIG